MRRSRSRRAYLGRLNAQINVVPYIDVMLVLLVILVLLVLALTNHALPAT